MPTTRSCRIPSRCPSSLLRPHLWVAMALAAAAGPSAAGEIQGPGYWGRSEAEAEAGVNVLSDTSASLSWQGLRYELNATNTATANSWAILEEAIAALAPGLGVDCFYRQTSGGWADLAKAGLGDPRPALPPGWAAGEISLTYYQPPAPGCPSGTGDSELPVQFSATLTHPSGRSVALRAETRLDATKPSPGLFSESGADWGEARWYFGLTFDGPGADESLVAAVAQALDPALDLPCQERLQELSDPQLSAYGPRAPQVPEGFHESWSIRTARTTLGPCASPGSGDLKLAWAYTSEDGMLLEIGASRSSLEPKGAAEAGAEVGEGYVRWTDAKGIAYYVYGHPLNDGPAMEREAVFALAHQLDPAVVLP